MHWQSWRGKVKTRTAGDVAGKDWDTGAAYVQLSIRIEASAARQD